MVEDGIAELDDILRDRIASLKMDRERIQTSLERVKTHAIPAAKIPPSVIADFGKKMREHLVSGEIPFRKAYLQSIVDEVEVGYELIRIIGSKAAIENAISGRKKFSKSVRSFERKWRTREDSNLWPLPSEGSALSS